MKIDIHFNFNGQCQKALQFYQSIMGGELTLLTYGESPAGEQMPANWQDKIVHGSLQLPNLEIAGADVQAQQYVPASGFQLLIQLDEEAECQRIFNALAENGTIIMPLQSTFWTTLYGIVHDQFGIPWEINYAAEDDE